MRLKGRPSSCYVTVDTVSTVEGKQSSLVSYCFPIWDNYVVEPEDSAGSFFFFFFVATSLLGDGQGRCLVAQELVGTGELGLL